MGSAFYISKLTKTISYIMFITKTGVGKGDTNRGVGGGVGWGCASRQNYQFSTLIVRNSPITGIRFVCLHLYTSVQWKSRLILSNFSRMI